MANNTRCGEITETSLWRVLVWNSNPLSTLSSTFLALEDSDAERSDQAPNLLSAAVDEGACQVPGGLGPALRVLRAELAVYAQDAFLFKKYLDRCEKNIKYAERLYFY
jgi:hypothetical protein